MAKKKKKTTPIRVGSKVSVQVGRKWLTGRVAEIAGVGCRVELANKDEHRSVYARTLGLRK